MTYRAKTNILLFVAAFFLVVSFSNQRSRAKIAQEEFTLRMGYPILVPLIELKSESGLAYDVAIKAHHELLRRYIKAVEDRRPPLPLRLFSFSSKTINLKEMKRLENELGKPLKDEKGELLLGEKKNDEARRRIEKEFKKTAAKLLVELQQLLSKTIIPSRRKEIPAGLREDVAKVLKESHDKVEVYISGINNISINESLDSSGLACHENRKAASLSFFASYMYEDFFVDKEILEMLERFKEDIDKTIRCNNVLSKSLSSDVEAGRRLRRYTESEVRRRDIAQAIIDDDMQEAQKLLLAAMIKAISEE